MENKGKNKTIGLIITILLSTAIIVLVFFFDRFFGLSQEALQEKIASYGAGAPIIFFIIQFLQVVISPIPGNVTTMAGGALFGFGKAFLISSTAIISGAIVGFYFAKKFGKPLVMRIAGEKNTEKYLNALTNSKTKKFIFIALMLLPFFPDDIICFVAGLTDMKWKFFVPTIIVTRPIGLFIAAFVGSSGLTYEPWMWITMSIIFVLTIILFIFLFKSRKSESSNK